MKLFVWNNQLICYEKSNPVLQIQIFILIFRNYHFVNLQIFIIFLLICKVIPEIRFLANKWPIYINKANWSILLLRQIKGIWMNTLFNKLIIIILYFWKAIYPFHTHSENFFIVFSCFVEISTNTDYVFFVSFLVVV